MLGGRNITGLRPTRSIAWGLSRSFQVTNIFPKLSVLENLRCARSGRWAARYSFWTRVAGAEGKTVERARRRPRSSGSALRARRDAPAGVLTYAEQRALEIGVAIAGGPTSSCSTNRPPA